MGHLGLFPRREGEFPSLIRLPVYLKHPGVTPARRQLQHGIEGERDIDVGARFHSGWAANLELAAHLDRLVTKRACLDDRPPIVVEQLNAEPYLPVGEVPWHVKEQGDSTLDRTRAPNCPTAA